MSPKYVTWVFRLWLLADTCSIYPCQQVERRFYLLLRLIQTMLPFSNFELDHLKGHNVLSV